jgi:hypothetical protein
VLTSLEIKNFRTFSHLLIERLGRVNLILGKNNVGKTTLLEALRLYGSIRPPSTIASILNERLELGRSTGGQTLLLLNSLFHGRRANHGDAFRIGPSGREDRTRTFVATAHIRPDEPDEAATGAHGPPERGTLSIQSAGVHFTLYPQGHWSCGGWAEAGTWTPPNEPPFDPPYLRSVGVQEDFAETIARWWDSISLTDSEGRVVDALEIIAPIRGVRLVGHPRTDGGRIAIGRVDDFREPVPVATLGDGVVRMFQLAVALEYAAVYAKHAADGELRSNMSPVLLVDEVEAGIHHTLHADLWRFIFHAARLLDVQVFATTHSWGCLKGFARAVAEDEENDGVAIRLEKVEGQEQTGAIIIDGNDLRVVVRNSIEVR